VAAGAAQELVELAQGAEPLDEESANQPLQVAALQQQGHVQCRSRRRRHRKSAPDAQVNRLEKVAAVKLDAGPGVEGPAVQDDVNRFLLRRTPHLPERCGALMTESRAGTEREQHGGLSPEFDGRVMADDEHTAVLAPHEAARHQPVDGAGRDPSGQELASSDPAPLGAGDGEDSLVPRPVDGGFCSVTEQQDLRRRISLTPRG
jgi:hypothetical protein